MVKQRKKKIVRRYPVENGEFVIRSMTLFEVQFIPKGMDSLKDSGETLHRFESGKAVSAFLKSQGLS